MFLRHTISLLEFYRDKPHHFLPTSICLAKTEVVYSEMVNLYFFILYLTMAVLDLSGTRADGRLLSLVAPDPNDAVVYARWLASQNSWGVLNTLAKDKDGAPFGNVVSFSDGLPGDGTGIPYFYLTTLDPTAEYALKDPRASFTISEYPLGTCGKTDPENPTCAKMTLTGKLILVKENTDEAAFAKSALFAKHTEMKGWPKGHNFQVFKLVITDIFLINYFGGPKPLTVDQYLRGKMSCPLALFF